ncbi:MAG: alpha-galactosidase [Clostridia bacterium]|nr:alpha-galactosidase [Clostridia bacterium]
MSIRIEEKEKLFSLETAHTLYQMKADETGVLLHTWYGAKTDTDMSYRIRTVNRGFCGNPYEMQNRFDYSLDTLPQEYSTDGVGDFRPSAVQVSLENGSRSVDWRYAGYRLLKGKEKPEGMPGLRGNAETEGIEIRLEDSAGGLQAFLTYWLFEAQDVIVRSARIENRGTGTVRLKKAASVCVDFPYGKKEVIHFHGRHAMERMPERIAVPRGGRLAFESRRGMSSHQSNPFIILCDPDTTERQGNCWGFMLMYSGNHLEEVCEDQTGNVRVISGIHPEGFEWQLEPQESFRTPEAILSFSAEGMNALSRNYHRIIREEVIAPRWRNAKKPVLINSWEATYFDFNAEKLLRLARSAKELGMEMLVLDDGWFGRRDDDTTSLGDWVCNEAKLGCSLKELTEKIHEIGLRFGLWFEPEMISPESDLYRKHPDWAFTDPDRLPMIARRQLVLDMGRKEVQDYLFETISGVLKSARIEYVKWDFNRSIANCWSHALPEDRQGEAAHRFMLGTYSLLERLTEAFPEVMIEGCSGGGGRFDAGMLYYCPQIWCSDDTDAIERIEIQRGTSYGYPVCTMGSHVSACPNHQTFRTVPLETRGIVAQSGTFGYELNPEKLTDAEKETVKAQIRDFHRFESLIEGGDYYRLETEEDYTAWMSVSPEKDEALLSVAAIRVRANGLFPFVKLQGLDPEKTYCREDTGEKMTGAALMCGGVSFQQMMGDFPCTQVYLRAWNNE